MRFAKYKGPEITNIEAHNERRKEKYASNPDIDLSRSKHNFHLIEPPQRYRAEAERQISAAGCRTRKDSVRLWKSCSPPHRNSFRARSCPEIRQYFEEALHFLEQYQAKGNNHLCRGAYGREDASYAPSLLFPLTPDGRLSAKEIVGNKKKLSLVAGQVLGAHGRQILPTWSAGESASQTAP